MPDTMTDPNLAATVHHSGGSYPVVAGWDILDHSSARCAETSCIASIASASSRCATGSPTTLRRNRAG